jgi:hypothetical protein
MYAAPAIATAVNTRDGTIVCIFDFSFRIKSGHWRNVRGGRILSPEWNFFADVTNAWWEREA